MNRYQIAKHKGIRSVAQVSNKQCDSPTTLFESMVKCVAMGVDLDATNIRDELLENCLVKLCKKYDAPLIVGNPRKVQLIRITQTYKKVYEVGHIPPKIVKVVLYYDVLDLPDSFKPILRVRKSPA